MDCGSGTGAIARPSVYETLNQLLKEASFAPGVYFRMLFVGYFEGIESERGLEWRCADSLVPGHTDPSKSTNLTA